MKDQLDPHVFRFRRLMLLSGLVDQTTLPFRLVLYRRLPTEAFLVIVNEI